MPTTVSSCDRLAALLRRSIKRAAALFFCFLLVWNVYYSGQRRAKALIGELAFLGAIVDGVATVGFGDMLLGGLGLAATGLYLGDLIVEEDKKIEFWNSIIGDSGVPANREYALAEYEKYVANPEAYTGFNIADVPDSLIESLSDGITDLVSDGTITGTKQNTGTISSPSAAPFVGTYEFAANPSTDFTPNIGSASDPYICLFKIYQSNGDNRSYWYRANQLSSAVIRLSFGTDSSSGSSRTILSRFTVNSGTSAVGYSGTSWQGYTSDVDLINSTRINTRTIINSVCAPYITGLNLPSSVPVAADTPSSISDIGQQIAAGTLSGGQAVPLVRDALGDVSVTVAPTYDTYTDSIGEPVVAPDVPSDVDLADILSALGVGGALGTILSGILSGITALPLNITTALADMLFNTHVQSFSSTALDSLDDILSQYVSSLPTWLQQTGTVLDGLPSNIALAMDGNFGDVITAVNQVLQQVTGIPAAIPEAFGSIITGIPAEVWGEFEGPIGDVITVLDGVLDGVLGIPRAITDAASSVVTGIGTLTLDVDLSGVLSSINAIPLSIASALGLDWVITGSDELSQQLEYPDSTSFALPSASWSDVTSVAEDFGELTPIPYFERSVNIVFDTFAGNGSSSAPRYVIVFPNPWGEDWQFVIDFALFDGRFVTISHALFYVSFAFWYWGFLQKIKAKWDDVLQMVYTHPIVGS